MQLHPIAIADAPLRSSYGRHAPYALRTIVELKTTDGITGISETYGGDGPLAASLPVQPANILEHLGDHSYEGMVMMVVEGIPPAMPPAAMGSDDVRLVLNYVWTLVPESERGRLRALQEMAAEEH